MKNKRFFSMMLCVLLVFSIVAIPTDSYANPVIALEIKESLMLGLAVGGYTFNNYTAWENTANLLYDAMQTDMLNYWHDNVVTWRNNGTIEISEEMFIEMMDLINTMSESHDVLQAYIRNTVHSVWLANEGIRVTYLDMDCPLQLTYSGFDSMLRSFMSYHPLGEVEQYIPIYSDKIYIYRANTSGKYNRVGRRYWNASTETYVNSDYGGTSFDFLDEYNAYFGLIMQRKVGGGSIVYCDFYGTWYDTIKYGSVYTLFSITDYEPQFFDYVESELNIEDVAPIVVGSYTPPVNEDDKVPIPWPADIPWEELLGKSGQDLLNGLGSGAGDPVIPGEGEYHGILGAIRSVVDSIADSLSVVCTWLADFVRIEDFEFDFEGLQVDFKDRFPFCIPFDFKNLISVFAAEPSDFVFTINLETSFFDINHTVDMTPYRIPLIFFRYIVVFWFVFILISRTRDWIKW